MQVVSHKVSLVFTGRKIHFTLNNESNTSYKVHLSIKSTFTGYTVHDTPASSFLKIISLHSTSDI